MLEVHSVVLVATGREAETNGKGLKQLVKRIQSIASHQSTCGYS
jgi:hypothetical protein